MTNGTVFKSLFMQQQMSPSMFLVYPGAYISRLTLSGSIGNFFTGSIDIIAKDRGSTTPPTPRPVPSYRPLARP